MICRIHWHICRIHSNNWAYSAQSSRASPAILISDREFSSVYKIIWPMIIASQQSLDRPNHFIKCRIRSTNPSFRPHQLKIRSILQGSLRSPQQNVQLFSPDSAFIRPDLPISTTESAHQSWIHHHSPTHPNHPGRSGQQADLRWMVGVFSYLRISPAISFLGWYDLGLTGQYAGKPAY